MANREYPRRGSAAALGLMALHNTGGRSMASAWALVLDWKGNAAHFKANIIDRLRICGLVITAGELVEITSDGYRYLGVDVAPVSDAVEMAVGPRYVAPMRPLNVAKHFPPRPQRQGAHDFQSIPSMMAGQRVEYRSGRD